MNVLGPPDALHKALKVAIAAAKTRYEEHLAYVGMGVTVTEEEYLADAALTALAPSLAEAQERINQLELACARQNEEVCQTLGKALGYPYLDHTVCSGCDPVSGCTCGNPQVCVGEHVAESLATEAAKALAAGRGGKVMQMLQDWLCRWCSTRLPYFGWHRCPKCGEEQ